MRTRGKRSIVWKMSDPEFSSIVNNSISIGDVCKKLGARHAGSFFTNIKIRIEKLDLDIGHFVDRRSMDYNVNYVDKKEFISRLNIYGPIDPKFHKKKLLEFELVKNECATCYLPPVWNRRPLVFHLDHIDGDFRNNNLSNTRLMCPNCHTQTPTYSMGTRPRKTYTCGDCGTGTAGYSSRCLSCASKVRETIKRTS